MNVSRRNIIIAGVIASTSSLSFSRLVNDYPVRPLRIIVPYPPGATQDYIARLLAQNMSVKFGQTVIVENRAGASGNNGADYVAKSDADGYTLVLVTPGHAIAPSLYKKLPYNIETDLIPVSQLSTGPMLVLTGLGKSYKSMSDLITAAKANPGGISYGSGGSGSTTHLAAEIIATAAGVKFNHIPYKGSAPAMVDLMSGTLDFAFELVYSAIPHVQGSKLRALAITSIKRSPLVPDVPTLKESGLPELDLAVWNGIMAPAKTPRHIVDKLNSVIREVMQSNQVREQLASRGFSVTASSPAAFSKFLDTEIKLWAEAVQASGAKVD